VSALIAQERSLFSHLHYASFDAKSQTPNQDLRHFPPRSLDNSAKGLSRDVHLLRGLFLMKPFEVSQPEGFELIHGENNLLQGRERQPNRLEHCASRLVTDSSAALGSGHSVVPCESIMSICS